MLLVTVLFVTACSNGENPYEEYNAAGFNVTVRYDANGGNFTTNNSIIEDSYDVSGMEVNKNGMVELALLSPDNDIRGKENKRVATRQGYFLVGWYAKRAENGTDSEGNTIYSYSDRWDFEEKILEVDPNGSYSADQPYVTLYAVWAPEYTINFYDKESGELLLTEKFDPLGGPYEIPAWDKTTGKMNMKDFPDAPDGYTFQAAYYEDGTLIETEFTKIPESLDLATGTASDTTYNIYLEWMEGEWYHIYTAKQLKDNANPNGNYELHADLDFADVAWPSKFAFETFNGTINGNGYAIKNVTVDQKSKTEENGGLFGVLGENAVVQNVTFENVTYNLFTQVSKGTPAYGIFAGKIISGATVSNVTLASGKIVIDSNCRLSDLGTVGLVCGSGSTEGITYDLENLTAVGGGKKPESVQISYSGEMVTFVIA